MTSLRAEITMSTKSPNPVDKHVGSRVRMRRMMLGMSQEKLGDALGVTFQQVQKNEKGINRIGASRLQQLSSLLQVRCRSSSKERRMRRFKTRARVRLHRRPTCSTFLLRATDWR